jgi:hypothetical protein
MSLFEAPLFGRPSTPGSPQLQENWWDVVDAATRLLYVRVALFILAEPRDPALGDTPWPLGDDWLSSRYRHSRVSGWQGAFLHAVQDALILVRSELPQPAVRRLRGAGRAYRYVRRDLLVRWGSRSVWSQASRRFWSQFSRKGGTLGQQVTKSLRFAGIGVSDTSGLNGRVRVA